MINRWMGDDPVEVVLKTDLFDEAVGKGLLPMLTHCADQMIGMDVSALVVEAARGHCPDMTSYCADVRQIPLGDASVDLIVSPSSLDHFEVIEDFEIALRELHRVLRPNGRLIITMDNAANPAVAIRNALPFIWMQKTGLVRYKIGATCGPKALRKHLESVGFEVEDFDAFLHCPRVCAVALTRWIESWGRPKLEHWTLSALMMMEQLSRFPLRFQTGYFVGCLAIRRSG